MLTAAAARHLLLHAQGLCTRPSQPASKPDVLAAIRRMGALQIDTIHVVARSPYFVLWSRLGDYEPRWLDELLAERTLFEYWARAACFLPIEDYRLYRPRMVGAWARSRAWFSARTDDTARMLARIRDGGAVRSADFERTDGRAGSWWNWKQEKRELEYLYLTGELMIARRDPNFHRVYDLRERVLPAWNDDQMPPAEEATRELILKAVRSLGVARPSWVPTYFGTARRLAAPMLQELARSGPIVEVSVDGMDGPCYVHADQLSAAKSAQAGELRSDVTTLLSPFDPVVWDRVRARELFGFDYRIETYTPAAQRRYGYFSLPILHRGGLIGRLDAKAHRKQGVFEVRSLHLEPGVHATDQMIAELGGALRACASWHGTPEVAVRESRPPEVAQALAAAAANAQA